jgi:CheY-like chemotaxis protein
MMDPVIYESAPSGADKQGLSILLVDDEAAVIEMMSTILQGFGHKIAATAGNGLDAIRLAAEKQPDLIILDVGMPGMDGIAVAEKILAVQSVPIIIVTGVTREEAVDRASQLEVLRCFQWVEGMSNAEARMTNDERMSKLE